MTVHQLVRAGTAAAGIITLGLLAGCSGSKASGAQSGKVPSQAAATTPATADSSTASSPSDSTSADSTAAVAATTSVAAATGSGAKCSDLSNAAASASIGKPTTVKLDNTPIALPGLSICTVTVSTEVYPIQLAVNTNQVQALYGADKSAFSGVDLPGVGDQAFSGATGIEVISHGVDIKITGPAGPVLNKDYTLATAVAKAMVSVLK